MLDTYGRKYIDKWIFRTAEIFIKISISANQVTILALFIGIISGILVYFKYYYMASILLWLSGFLDAVDGAIARKNNKTTYFGTLLDITFDRVVEMSVIIALAVNNPNAIMELLLLTIAILLSMTIFLTVGALSNNKGMKSFYYQAGITERTEGFILLTLMIILPDKIEIIANIFFVLVMITALQRLLEGKKILS